MIQEDYLPLEHHPNPVLCLFKDKVCQTKSWQETGYTPDDSDEETLLMGLLTELWPGLREQLGMVRHPESGYSSKPLPPLGQGTEIVLLEPSECWSPCIRACPTGAVTMNGHNNCQTRH